MRKNKKKGVPLYMVILIVLVGIIGIVIINKNLNNETNAGHISNGKVVYSETIVNKMYNKETQMKTLEIDTVNHEINNVIMTSKTIESLKNNSNEYKRTLKEVLDDSQTISRNFYDISKSIELGIVNENTELKDYYAKVTGFKNTNNFIKFCENAFKLMEKDNDL